MPKIQQPTIVNQKKSNFFGIAINRQSEIAILRNDYSFAFFYKMNPPIIQNIFDKKGRGLKTAPLRFYANAHLFFCLGFFRAF